MSFWNGLSYEPYPILGTRARMLEEVADFRAWAEADPERSSREGWEYGYDFWSVLTAVFCKFLDASEPRAWDGDIVDALLYILARDEGMGVLRREIAARPADLAALAEAGPYSDEIYARCQLVDALAEFARDRAELGEAEVLRLLRTYAGDEDGYVRRLALLALARRGAPDAEARARRTWISGDEWERIGVLHALETVGSPHLAAYLAVAERDERTHLVEHARAIDARQKDVQAPSGAP